MSGDTARTFSGASIEPERSMPGSEVHDDPMLKGPEELPVLESRVRRLIELYERMMSSVHK